MNQMNNRYMNNLYSTGKDQNLQLKPLPKSYKSSIEASNKTQTLISQEYSRKNRMLNRITLESGFAESPNAMSDAQSPTVHLNKLIRKSPTQEF